MNKELNKTLSNEQELRPVQNAISYNILLNTMWHFRWFSLKIYSTGLTVNRKQEPMLEPSAAFSVGCDSGVRQYTLIRHNQIEACGGSDVFVFSPTLRDSKMGLKIPLQK